jgi:y4mF family transcriptional regulator
MSTALINNWTKLGSIVRDTRRRRGWSQAELARRAHVSRAWLAKLEAGHRGAELEQILRLLAALGLALAVREATVRFTDDVADGSAGQAATSLRHMDERRLATQELAAARRYAAANRRQAWGLADRSSSAIQPVPERSKA